MQSILLISILNIYINLTMFNNVQCIWNGVTFPHTFILNHDKEQDWTRLNKIELAQYMRQSDIDN